MANIVVFVTASSGEEATAMAKTLVVERLAACVNIIDGVRSIYRWEGNVVDDTEVLMIAKSTEDLFEKLSARVKELHSYTVPEIIAVPIIKGSTEYMLWISKVTGQ